MFATGFLFGLGFFLAGIVVATAMVLIVGLIGLRK